MKHYIYIPVLLLTMGLFSCASHLYHFTSQPPVWFYNDIHPIPLPDNVYQDRFNYYANVTPPRPTVSSTFIASNDRARDVNSQDQVPASSWYIPRLGVDPISPDELVNGPSEFGPPQPPLMLHKIRSAEDNPRLFIMDSRNIYYLLKMDPPGFYGLATGTSFIVNRLFWGFGYNVPEDHLYYFKREDLVPSPESGYSTEYIDEIMSRVATPHMGSFRAIASRIIDGLPLGPAPAKGVRKNDPNDLFPHQERRILRALRVFGAFVNMYDIGADNLFDIYVGPPGQGYIKHYLVDFDNALGTYAIENDHIWAGFNHIFNMTDIIRNTLTFGLIVQDWEHIRPTQWNSVGAFEADFFKPENWKETHPFEPIQNSQNSDNYWAAKILSQVSDEQLAALVRAGEYPPEAGDYVLNTLIERRNKVLHYYLNQVTPVEYKSISDSEIVFYDLAEETMQQNETDRYKFRIVNSRNKTIFPEQVIHSDRNELRIALFPEWFKGANPYFCIIITKVDPDPLPPVQFHITLDGNDRPVIAGIVH